MTKKKSKPARPQKPVQPAKPPSPAAIWLAAHGTFEHIERLHEAAHDALSLLLALESTSALRLPFRGYEETVKALRDILK